MGELIRNKNGNRLLLVITDLFTKWNRTIKLKRITATAVAHDFVQHWVFVYRPPKTALYDNGSQFMVRFFTEMCRIIGTKMSMWQRTTLNVAGKWSGLTVQYYQPYGINLVITRDSGIYSRTSSLMRTVPKWIVLRKWNSLSWYFRDNRHIWH